MSCSSFFLPSRERNGRRRRRRGFILWKLETGDLGPETGLSGRFHHERDDGGHAVPALGGDLELFAAGAGEGVILGAAVVLGGPPLGLDPALLLHAVEGGVERTLVDLQRAL